VEADLLNAASAGCPRLHDATVEGNYPNFGASLRPTIAVVDFHHVTSRVEYTA